ncbi:MAG: Gfo/Idh/MocA family oxidoreductase [Bacteroidota bacterium]
MSNDSRRAFIRKTGIGAAGLALAGPAFSNHRRVAPSDTLNVGLIGCRSMGFGNLRNQLSFDDARCIALCDVDQNVLDKRTADVVNDFGDRPKQYKDFRKMLENKDLDAVVIGTPDHWHCLPYVYACQEGKAVYVEKPMANSIEECNLMVRAADRYQTVVQVGQQQRSGEHWQQIMRKIHSGELGKLRKVEIWANFNYGVGRKMLPDEPVPDGVDYDFWQGPAPARSTFNPTRFHGSWRMFWDYGGGLMTDWGVHLIDMALWAGEVTSAPNAVMAFGKNLSYEDHNHETYDTMSVIWPQEDYLISWEHTAGTQNGPDDMLYGLRFICDDATIVANRNGFQLVPEWDNEKQTHTMEPLKMEVEGENHRVHARDFLDCVKSGSRDTACPPAIGRQVALYAHMANIAVRSGEGRLVWDESKNRFSDGKSANAFIEPAYRKPWELPKL